MSTPEILGQLVISSSFGVGRVIGIDKIGADDREFMVVECEGQKVKNFIPINDKDSYRLVSTEKTIKKILKDLGKKSDLQDFESKKDRIHYFKANSQIQDVELMAKLLVELNDLPDRGSAENLIHARLIDTLSLEFSISSQDDVEKTKEIVMNALKN